MKTHQIFLMAFLCLAGITFLSACSKDDPKPNCKIITITPTSGTAYNISYNTEGKVSTITSGTSTTTYAYSGNTAIGTKTNSGAFASRVIATYNANGLATNVRTENNESGTNWDNMAFEYSGTELVKQTFTSSAGGVPSVTTVVWTGGNPTTITSGSTISTVDYHSNIAAQTGDYWDISQLIQGYRIIHAKNAIKSLLSGSTINTFDYTIDGEGKITGVTVTGGGTSSGFTYQYQCN